MGRAPISNQPAELGRSPRRGAGCFLPGDLRKISRLRVSPLQSAAVSTPHHPVGIRAPRRANPNLVATKNSTTDETRIQSLLSETPQLQHFITEQGFAYASTLEAMRGELNALRTEMKHIVADSTHMDGSFDKMFARANDPEFPLRLLPPYCSVSEECFTSFTTMVNARFSRWIP